MSTLKHYSDEELVKRIVKQLRYNCICNDVYDAITLVAHETGVGWAILLRLYDSDCNNREANAKFVRGL